MAFDELCVCGLEIPQRIISLTFFCCLLSHKQSHNCIESCTLDTQQTFENCPCEDQNISSTCTNLMEMMLQIRPSMGFTQTKQKKCMKILKQDFYSMVSNLTVCPPVTNEKKQPVYEDVLVELFKICLNCSRSSRTFSSNKSSHTS